MNLTLNKPEVSAKQKHHEQNQNTNKTPRGENKHLHNIKGLIYFMHKVLYKWVRKECPTPTTHRKKKDMKKQFREKETQMAQKFQRCLMSLKTREMQMIIINAIPHILK